VSNGERPEETDFEQSHLLALAGQEFHGLVRGLGTAAHHDDDALGIGSSDILEEPVLASDSLCKAVHHPLDDIGRLQIVGVDRLTCLEEHIGVLRRTAKYRVIGRECPLTVRADLLVVDERPHVIVGEFLDLHDFVGGPEPVEEVEEGDAGFQRGSLRDQDEIHHLLHAVR
jgi:hypothetical protein